MEHFCTYFDIGFLPQGMALQSSLQKHSESFILWILCLDEAVEKALDKLQLPSVRLINLSDIETPELLTVKPGRSRSEYCWTLTPFLPKVVMELEPNADRVTYVDADCWFINNPNRIFKEMDDSGKVVLITPHDYTLERDLSAASGKYCVQFMPFRRTASALKVLQWWQTRCLEWCFARLDNGRFGDQMYLDHWPELFPETVHILKETRLTMAPWHAIRFAHLRNLHEIGCMFHFHDLRLFDPGKVRINMRFPLPKTVVDQIYNPYVEELGRLIRFADQKGISLRFPEGPYPDFSSKARSLYRRLFKYEKWRSLA